MKRISLYTIAIAALLFISSACSEDYLETAPTDQVAEASVFANVTNAWGAINGIHRNMYLRFNSQGQGGYGGLMIIKDMLGEDLVMTSAGNGWYNNIYKWLDHRNETDSDLLYPWNFYYKQIANANMIISKIDEAEGDQNDKSYILGQALVYRAWGHFELVQLYGGRYIASQNNTQLGVPLMVTPTFEGQPRATVEEVYTQILDDLNEAIPLLAGYDRLNKSHINADVAKGIKARVALTMQDWSTAAAVAGEVISDGNYDLMPQADYTSGFNDYENDEWMWGCHVIEEQTTYFAHFHAYMSRNFSSTNIRTNPKAINSLLYDQISDTDVRKAVFDETGEHTDLGLPSSFTEFPYTSQKFLAYGGADSRGDVSFMRLAEMYLIRAEALARTPGQEATAAQVLFNLVSARDDDYVLSTNTGQALIDEILTHRRIELWGEGFRFLDLKRTNSALDRTGANHNASLANILQVPAGDNAWQWLIPKSEIDANPAMEGQQNPL